MNTTEGMGRRAIGPETDDDDVIKSHKRHRVNNHGDQAKAAKRARRRERRLVRAGLRSGNVED